MKKHKNFNREIHRVYFENHKETEQAITLNQECYYNDGTRISAEIINWKSRNKKSSSNISNAYHNGIELHQRKA